MPHLELIFLHSESADGCNARRVRTADVSTPGAEPRCFACACSRPYAGTRAACTVRDTLQRRCNERRDDLVYRLEVIVKRTIRDVCLFGYVVDGRGIDALAPKNDFGRSKDGVACPLASPLVTIGNGGRIALGCFGHRISELTQQARRAAHCVKE